MTAGNQPSVASVNSQAGGLAVQLRSLMQQIQNFQAWLAVEGSAGLVAIGFTAGDAATIISTFGNLNTLAGIYAGAAPGAAFNYESNSNSLWGGQ